jgi:hypothetical protein
VLDGRVGQLTFRSSSFVLRVHSAYRTHAAPATPAHPGVLKMEEARMNGSRMHTDRFQGLEPATSSLAILTQQTYRCICTRRKDTLWKSNLAIVEANIADIASNKTLPHRIHWTLPQLTVRIGYPLSPAIIPHGTSQPYSKASLVEFQSLAFAMHLAPSAK